jgi:hypothetical protein
VTVWVRLESLPGPDFRDQLGSPARLTATQTR